MEKVVIHSDGGCQGNPGPGGWAAVLTSGPHRREISGGEPATTNNRMELQAAIAAFEALKRPCEVEFHTDSNYLKNGVTAWMFAWKKNGWLTKARQPVKNDDLWRRLEAAIRPHEVKWHWVKGHSGDVSNERCDVLATAEIQKIRRAYSAPQLETMLKEARAAKAAAPGPPQASLL